MANLNVESNFSLEMAEMTRETPAHYNEWNKRHEKLLNNDAYLYNKNNQLKAEIDVERKRIDNMQSIPEGSTSADAALYDLMVGYDGKTWKTPGEAVRGQMRQSSDDINALKNKRNFPYPFTMDSTLKRPLDNNDVYTEEMNGIVYLKVYTHDTNSYYVSQLYSYSTSENCCIRIDRDDGERYGLVKHKIESKESRGIESITIFDNDGDLFAEAVIDWSKIITNIGVGLDATSTKIQESCMCRMYNPKMCVQGIPIAVTTDNYESILPDLDCATPNRIYLITGVPVANHPQETTNAGGTFCPLSPYDTGGKDGEVQLFWGRYGELYIRRMWSGTYTSWQVESRWGKLVGKTMYCDGDSIAAGYKRNTDEWQIPYAEQIANKYGMKLKNAAVGGTTLAVREGRTDSICERMQANLVDTKVEFINFDGGINDVWNGVPLGAVVESDKIWEEEYDITTTVGALETLCKFLIKNQPAAEKLFIFTHPTLGELSKQDAYFAEMKKALDKWGFEYVDIRHRSGMIPLNDEIKELFFYKNADGTLDSYHTTTEAYKKLYIPPIEAKMMSM